MSELTYSVRAGDTVFETDERGALAALAHAAGCQGCSEPGAFHRSDIYGSPGLTPPEVFLVRLPTGATLYPGSRGDLPVAERVAAALAVLRRAAQGRDITPVMSEAIAERIQRLEAYRPQ